MQTLTDAQIRRYARHILLPDIGGTGQLRLLAAAVVVPVGPDCAAEAVALLYLAAAGVGHLLLSGSAGDPVTPEEARAAILYGPSDLGRPRLDAISERIGRINPDVHVAHASEDRALHAIALAPLPPIPASWLAGEHPEDHIASALACGGVRAVQTLSRLLTAQAQEVIHEPS